MVANRDKVVVQIQSLGHCGSCRFWKRPEDRADYITAVIYAGENYDAEKDCYPRRDADDRLFGVCEKIGLGVDLPLNEPAPLAVTKDSSEYRADLFTQSSFGCILWERKET